MTDYNGQIDWGDWQQMPDYRAGWRNKHKSGVAEIGRAFDVVTYIPGLNKVSNFLHDGTGQVMTGLNTVLSPVVSTVNKYTQPGFNKLNEGNFIGNINRFIEEKPADAAAIAAATYFTGGALSGWLSSAGAAGGGAAAGAAGTAAAPAAGTAAAAGTAGAMGGMAGSTAAGLAALTPTFASGAVAAPAAAAASGTAGLTAAGAAAITPTFASGVGAGLVGAAPAVGTGTLGAAGTAAANSLLTPAFSSGVVGGAGTAAGSGGWLTTAKDILNTAKTINSYRSNLQTVADANKAPTDRERYNAMAASMGERILNAGAQPVTPRQRVARQMMLNRLGMRA